VRRGLREKLVALCEIGMIGYSVLGRGLIETQGLFCFYGVQLLLQFGEGTGFGELYIFRDYSRKCEKNEF
jgi:hypothetical protein